MGEGHVHGPGAPQGAPAFRTVSLRGPLGMIFACMVVSFIWGYSNDTKLDKTLEKLDAIEQRLDSIAPVKSE